MNIILGMLTLDYAGVPTYVLTLARELEKRGHRVTLYCPSSTSRPMAGLFTEIQDSTCALPHPGVMVAHHTSIAEPLRERFPDVPLVFVAHGIFSPESKLPPVRVERYVVINEQVQERLFWYGLRADKTDLIRDFVDTDRFFPTSELRNENPRILFLSNYRRWKNYYYALDACARAGWPFTAVGSPYGRRKDVEKAINEADIVMSWGRGILEAMACGRTVISYDMARFNDHEPSRVVGDGYLDEDTYLKSREHNFGPEGCAKEFHGPADVITELAKYDPRDFVNNRDLALHHHGHVTGVDQMLDCFRKAGAPC